MSQTVGVNIAGDIAVFIQNQFSGRGNSDNIAVFIRNHTIGISFSQLIAVGVANYAVFTDNTNNFSVRSHCIAHRAASLQIRLRSRCRTAAGSTSIAKITIFFMNGITVNRHFIMLGVVIRNIGFTPGNLKIVLHVCRHARRPTHGYGTSDFAAQLFIITVIFKFKAFESRFFQIYGNNANRSLAVGTNSQHIRGFIAQNHLPHIYRIRGQSYRTFDFFAFIKLNFRLIISGISAHT